MNKLATLTAVATLAAGLVFSAQTVAQTVAGEGLGSDHYQCYTTRFAKGELPFDPRVVLLTDQFNDPEKARKSVRNVKIFCAPVDTDGKGIINPESHLVCYTIKPNQSPAFILLVTNEFGKQRLRVEKPTLLCVPSTKQIIEKDN